MGNADGLLPVGIVVVPELLDNLLGLREIKAVVPDPFAQGGQAFLQAGHGGGMGGIIINIPVLDLYGSDDLPGVLETAVLRKQAATHNVRYSQQVIQGANHFFDEMEDELIRTVADWSQQF